MGVFKEAKNAYRERKAEIKADRQAKIAEQQAIKAMEAMSLADETESRYSARSRSRRHRSEHHRGPELRIRPPTERYNSGMSVRSATSSRSQSVAPRQSSRTIYHSSRSVPSSPDRPNAMIPRRHTTQDIALSHPARPVPKRTSSTSAIDMDLAYGHIHPKSLAAYNPEPEQKDLSSLITKAKGILDEADCAHASVTAIIAHLQKHPDAMAAVALTLAEISNLVSKMAPGALTALKASAPAVFALLASPQFLIAAGVGVGITVVMLGGYKVIKKIKAKEELQKEGSMDEMMEITSDLPNIDRIENWRRGIADSQVGESAAGTSVEGEYITPIAAQMRRSTGPMAMPVPASTTRSDDTKSKKTSKSKKKSGKAGSMKSSSGAGGSSEKGSKTTKAKKPSPLRLMFK
ncbi:hypothetical protein UCRPC4_g04423 [Phaeomoniella chlamydospora]|uniref:Uncharacterized protein n=1 Tax=Phaeomoniella chlamydospora TaxID=158046 RepID=A0A0G2E9P9_PHACM|nr:hypothetical protein UCRPC4_g04423 [Phaeomoniella chlamydospora]